MDKNILDYTETIEIDEIITEFNEDIRDIIKEKGLNELKEKGIDNLTFEDLMAFDIPYFIQKQSDSYCEVTYNKEDETFTLFYKDAYESY